MDHRPTTNTTNTNTTNELFICFTSRLSSSSSSMKLSSKSILSPNRRDPTNTTTTNNNNATNSHHHVASLSTSLSRRLRNNSSMKHVGQSSPMFPTGSRKRGSGPGFDNPEPSSPKVTCIGQVRVKSKKKKHKNLVKRSRNEVSFRKGGNDSFGECSSVQRSQRWVHLPLTICEALRAFGAEFSCLLPCKPSSCLSSSEKSKEAEKGGSGAGGGGGCGAVLARWLVAVQGREIEMVVGEEPEEQGSIRRREISIDNVEAKDDVFKEVDVEDEEEGRVSVCIPPRNALLLMRCRSDPLRVSSLANRFWDSPAPREVEDDDDDDDDEDEEHQESDRVNVLFGEVREHNVLEKAEAVAKDEEVKVEVECSEEVAFCSSPKAIVDHESEQEEHQEEEEERRLSLASAASSSSSTLSLHFPLSEADTEVEADDTEVEVEVEVEAEHDLEEPMRETEKNPDEFFEQIEETGTGDGDGDGHVSVLPDCLLLMMCEPKLSMEVSKETWVCSTDFIRVLPERVPAKPPVAAGEVVKERVSVDEGSYPAHHAQRDQGQGEVPQAPPHAAAAESMATMIEKKLVNAAAYEPFVLKRCKSEPLRSAAKLTPEACFWKNRKLEPHRRSAVGVGTAGIGF